LIAFKDYIVCLMVIVLCAFGNIQDAYATNSSYSGAPGNSYDLIVVGIGSGGFGAALAGIYSFGRHISWDGWGAFPGGEHIIDSKRRYADTLRRHPGPGKLADATFRKAQWNLSQSTVAWGRI
jgi:hypothetical protein